MKKMVKIPKITLKRRKLKGMPYKITPDYEIITSENGMIAVKYQGKNPIKTFPSGTAS